MSRPEGEKTTLGFDDDGFLGGLARKSLYQGIKDNLRQKKWPIMGAGMMRSISSVARPRIKSKFQDENRDSDKEHDHGCSMTRGEKLSNGGKLFDFQACDGR